MRHAKDAVNAAAGVAAAGVTVAATASAAKAVATAVRDAPTLGVTAAAKRAAKVVAKRAAKVAPTFVAKVVRMLAVKVAAKVAAGAPNAASGRRATKWSAPKASRRAVSMSAVRARPAGTAAPWKAAAKVVPNHVVKAAVARARNVSRAAPSP